MTGFACAFQNQEIRKLYLGVTTKPLQRHRNNSGVFNGQSLVTEDLFDHLRDLGGLALVGRFENPRHLGQDDM